VTQVGEGPRAAEPAAGPLGGLSAGEVLAERYRLEQHINNDGAGRQVWRGVDMVLRRPVAIVLRHPGGESAQEMLSAAVTASRVVHPNLIGVYDAIDEGTRAYVVREWIDGSALRDLVREDGPFDAEQTTSTLHAVAEAVAALHASGMAHGNIHPGPVLIGGDGRVVLADSRVDTHTSNEADVRCIGALGYFMLTGHWPRVEGSRSALPDARRDSSGALIAPRLIRAGVPAYLDDLVMDLLNPNLALPTAQVLASELARLDTGEQLLFGGAGTLRFADESVSEGSRSATPKLLAAGGVALALVAAGLVLGMKALNAGSSTLPSARPSASFGANPSPSLAPAVKPHAIKLRPDQVRIVDPKGDRAETKNAARMVDGNTETIWKTNWYRQSNFGTQKPGIGILIKLDAEELVSSVTVQATAAGTDAELRTGTADAPDSKAGDKMIVDSYKVVAGQEFTNGGSRMVFSTDLSTKYQYLMIWITNLPPESSGGTFRIEVQEIVVEVQ
jgi:hypothetical protein